jgi:hypothetical protein
MSRIRCLLIAVVAVAAVPTASAAAALNLSDPVALPKSLPGTGQMQGGEPSLAFDPTGDGHLYAVAPGGADKGINFWGSGDNGATWQYVRTIGSNAGGGDSDVEVGIDHKVYALDLEVASSAVCRSTDFGKTFGDGCETGAAQDQAGAEEDRQWLAHDPSDANTVYFNYHDFVLQAPIIEKSTDGGGSFSPCGNLVDPTNALFPSAIGNTIVGKTAVAKDGNIYVPVGAPTMTQVAQSGTSGVADYGQIVIAHHKGCNGDQFDNTVVYSNDGGSFSNLFISNAVGPDNAVYVIASGRLDATGPYNTYLWVSRDQGKTFSKTPIKVNSGDLTANVMSAVAAGNKPGQVVLGWYGSQNVKTPNDTKGEWRYYLARSDDYGATWQQATVTPNVFHYGDICTVGILCTSGNRNLLDFSSVGVDPKTGCATTIFPGDPFDTPDREAANDTDPAAAYIAREGCSASAGGGTGSTGEVLGQKAGCHDKIAPVTTIGRGSRFTRKGITLKGTASDKGCGPNGRGTVSRVSLAISRRVGKKCQWLQAKGGFSSVRSCTKKTYVTAKGTSKWTYKLKAGLKKGTYAVVPRAIDSVGNQEKPLRGSRKARHNHNRYLFKVR